MSAPSGALSRRTMLAAGAALIAVAPAWAQQPGRKYRLGFLAQSPRPAYDAMFSELHRLGFVEGSNLLVDPGGFGLTVEQLEPVAVAVMLAQPDAVYCGGEAATRAGLRASATVPIVTISDDVVRNRLVSSLAGPGGNVTGISILATELDAKRQELLLEMVPGARHIAALVDPSTTADERLQPLIASAGARGVQVSIQHADSLPRIASAIAAMRAVGAQAVNVFASALFNANRALIIEHMAAARLPAIYQFPEHCGDGALVGYGASRTALFRQAGGMLAKVMTGTRPADLPVQQPANVELCLNLRTARELALTIPQSILARADEVIE